MAAVYRGVEPGDVARPVLGRDDPGTIAVLALAVLPEGSSGSLQVTVGAIRGQVVVRMPRRMGQMPGPAVGVDVSPDPGD